MVRDRWISPDGEMVQVRMCGVVRRGASAVLGVMSSDGVNQKRLDFTPDRLSLANSSKHLEMLRFPGAEYSHILVEQTVGTYLIVMSLK